MRSQRGIQALLGAALILLLCGRAAGQQDLQQKMQSQMQAGRVARPAANPRSLQLSVAPVDIEKLKVAPGFVLGLSVLEDDDFTGNFRVDAQGAIMVPVLGRVQVSGQTVSEIGNEIRARLVRERILINPQVSLSLVEYVPPEVVILGEVNAPGSYPLLAPAPLVKVLSLAGGLSILAGDRLQITRAGNPSASKNVHYTGATEAGDVADILVEPGDTIQVKRAGIVYVLGAVNRPGGFIMQQESTMTLLQAIALAYGTSTIASTSNVFVLRPKADGQVERLVYSYKKIVHGQSADVQLQPKDVLFVPSSALRYMLNNSQAIMSAATSAAIYSINR